MRSTLYFFLAGILLSACDNGIPVALPAVSTDFLKGDLTIQNSAFFLIGPDIDSVNAQVVAECDCCASELALLNDTSFIYTALCLGGDSYVKGNYVFFGNLLILHTDEDVISEEYEYAAAPDGGDTPIHYEVIKQERKFHIYQLSALKGKPFITYTSKDDYKEYGTPVKGSMNDFLGEFRKEKVLKRFLEDE